MFENRYGSTDTFKMAADQRKMTCASKCRNFVNNSRNCTKFEAQGGHDFLYFDLLTSHDLIVTFTVVQKLWRKWTLAQKLLVLECCNFGKSNSLYSGFLYF